MNRDDAFADAFARARAAVHRRVEKVRAQDGEPWRRTIARAAYLTACVLANGLVLLEIPRAVPGWAGWAGFAVALAVVVHLQARLYRWWFEPAAGAPSRRAR